MVCVTRYSLRWRRWLNPSPPWLRRLRLPHDPLSLRTCRQWNLAGICAGDRCCAARCPVHWPLCAAFRIARFVVRLRFDDPASMVERDRRMESVAYVATGSSVIGGFYHYANLLLHDATGQVTSAVFLALIETLAVLNSSEEQISEQEGVRPRGSL